MTQDMLTVISVALSIATLYIVALLWANASLPSTLSRLRKTLQSGGPELLSRKDSFEANLRFKRAFDIAFSMTAIIVFIPILELIAIAIKLEDKGPVFYKQPRKGENGQPFGQLKFRTIRVLASEKPGEFPRRGDPRVTRVGNFLRRTGLDELPALLNIFVGHMSVVGRSRILDYRETEGLLTDEQSRELLRVKPGLVSLWSVSGELARFDRRHILDYDMYYVTHTSLKLDLQIVFVAVVQIFGYAAKL